MQFLKSNRIYTIVRITGSQDNILGISFAERSVGGYLTTGSIGNVKKI